MLTRSRFIRIFRRERRTMSSHFKDLVSKIERAMKKQSAHSREVGDERQKKVLSVLETLKKEKKIKDFLETGKLSFTDVREGIDCYVVLVGATYKTVPLSVTGPIWAEEHRMQHPNVPVISVDLSFSDEALTRSIREQLAAILAA